MRIVYLFVFFILTALNVNCLIRVPDDYPSLQEAVEHCAEVDEIVITAENAELLKSYGDLLNYRGVGGIRIVGKQLVIRSATDTYRATLSSHYIPVFLNRDSKIDPVFPYLYREEHSVFTIQNSKVTFKDIDIDYTRGNILSGGSYSPISCPIIIDSSNVLFKNCFIRSVIKTNSNLRLIDTNVQSKVSIESRRVWIALDYPILFLDSCDGAKIELTRSTIQSIFYEQEAVRINDCINTDFILDQSTINSYHSSRIAASDGVKVIDSNAVRLSLNQSTIQAGDGVRVEGPNYYTYPPFFLPDTFYDGVKGGSGISLINSSITITKGEVRGGTGSPGKQVTFGSTHTDFCGDGGDAIRLENSHLQYDNTHLSPGLGGETFTGKVDGIDYPAGADGIEIRMDENSSVYTTSSIQNWELF